MDGLKLVRPQEPPVDVQQVLDASAHLRISEFDLFRLAWERWTGRDVDEQHLEQLFAKYMFQQSVPPWARHFAREVMTCVEAGQLDRSAFGADRMRRREPFSTPGHAPNPAPVWVTAGIFGVFFMLILNTSYDPQTSAPIACETGPGMRTISQIAYALSGNPIPNCLR